MTGENAAMQRPRRPHSQDSHAWYCRHRLLTLMIGGVSAKTPTVATAMPIARFLLLIALPPQGFSRSFTLKTRIGLIMRFLLAPAQPGEELL